ncbi:MAG: DNA repair protein RadC [Cyanobacteria bacterium REEB65]|nr:DNA repair protein RadC [Cyanobacteria bacterium REEB65]
MHARKPRERLWLQGPATLSEVELLAILLSTGRAGAPVLAVAAELAKAFPGQALQTASAQELCSVPGVGPAKATRLAAAVELGRRANVPGVDRPIVRSAADAFAIAAPRLDGNSQEAVVTLLLDAKGRLIGDPLVALGGLTQVDLHPREIFRPAIRHGAATLLLAHGHPSGDPTPSTADLDATALILEAGAIVGIPVVDHLVIGGGRYVSLRATTRLWDAPPALKGRI